MACLAVSAAGFFRLAGPYRREQMMNITPILGPLSFVKPYMLYIPIAMGSLT
jgi:hypothetical protein